MEILTAMAWGFGLSVGSFLAKVAIFLVFMIVLYLLVKLI